MKSLIDNINRSKFSGIFYVFFSSVLTSLSFAPWKLWPLGFLCITPIFYYIEKIEMNNKPILKIIGLGCLQGILISFFAYHWVIHTMVVFGHLPISVAIVIFFLYAVGTNLRWIFFFLLLYWLKKNREKLSKEIKNPVLHFISKPSFFCMVAWSIAEYLGWQLFPYYGGSLVSGNLIFIQMVDFIGVFGASIIWILINYTLYEAVVVQRKIPVLALVILAISHLYGGFAYYYWNSQQKSYPTANIGVVQGNTPLGFKGRRSMQSIANIYLNNMIFQSNKIMQKGEAKGTPLDIIVWPESSVPYASYESFAPFKERLKLFQEKNKVELIIPDLLVTHNRDTRKRAIYNNVFLLNKSGKILENYQKVILLPFGEFLPLSDMFPSYQKFFAEVSNFNHGNKFSLFPAELGNIMPLICYEVILPNFVLNFHKFTQEKAQIMINITNDTWFGDSIESSQHLELARLRSIELRIPLVRGVNAGISTHFDITGRSFGETELLTSANPIYTVSVPPEGTKTLYTLFGSYLNRCFLLIFSILLAFYFYRTSVANTKILKK